MHHIKLTDDSPWKKQIYDDLHHHNKYSELLVVFFEKLKKTAELDIKAAERRFYEEKQILLLEKRQLTEEIQMNRVAALENTTNNIVAALEPSNVEAAPVAPATVAELEAKLKKREVEYLRVQFSLAQQQKDNVNLQSKIQELEQQLQQLKSGNFGMSSVLHSTVAGSTLFSSDTVAKVPSTMMKHCRLHKGAINACAFDPTGVYVATAGADNTAQINQVVGDEGIGFKRIATLKANGAVTCVRFSRDANHLIYGGADHTATIYSLSTQSSIKLDDHKKPIVMADFDIDSKKCITTSTNRMLKIWDVEKGYCIKTNYADSSFRDFRVTSDNLIWSGHVDGNIRMWDLRTNNLDCQRIIPTQPSNNPISSISLSPDEKTAFTTSRHHTRLYDLSNLQVVREFKHPALVPSDHKVPGCFSPEGHFVAAGTSSGSVCVWNAFDGESKPDLIVGNSNKICALDWNKQGKMVIVDSEGNGVGFL